MAKNEKSEAAEKIEKAAKAKKAGAPKQKNGNIFKRMGKSISKFCKDFKGEIKKITWPGAKMVVKSTLVVLVSIIIIGLAVFAVDWVLSRGVDGLESLASKASTSETQDTDETADEAEEASEDTQEAEDTADKTEEPTSTTSQATTEASTQADAG